MDDESDKIQFGPHLPSKIFRLLPCSLLIITLAENTFSFVLIRSGFHKGVHLRASRVQKKLPVEPWGVGNSKIQLRTHLVSKGFLFFLCILDSRLEVCYSFLWRIHKYYSHA